MNWLRKPGSEQALAADDFAMLEAMLTGKGAQPAPRFAGETRAKYHAARSQPGAAGSHPLTGGVNFYRASPMHPPQPGEAAPDVSRLNPDDFVVRVPTLVIWGERDTALPKSLVEARIASCPACGWSASRRARTGSSMSSRSASTG